MRYLFDEESRLFQAYSDHEIEVPRSSAGLRADFRPSIVPGRRQHWSMAKIDFSFEFRIAGGKYGTPCGAEH